MFGPWLAVFGWLRQRVPHGWSAFKPRLNFITLHCAYTDIATWQVLRRIDMYITLMTIVGSIILYPGNNMAYIDALFFASGGATQSGLNT